MFSKHATGTYAKSHRMGQGIRHLGAHVKSLWKKTESRQHFDTTIGLFHETLGARATLNMRVPHTYHTDMCSQSWCPQKLQNVSAQRTSIEMKTWSRPRCGQSLARLCCLSMACTICVEHPVAHAKRTCAVRHEVYKSFRHASRQATSLEN